MFTSKKGFELSINMIVVMVIGLVLLGAGFSIFSNAFSKTAELRENVDSDTQRQLNAMLDDGSIVTVPFTNKQAKRGDYVDFNLGINNEMGDTRKFKVIVTYGGSTAFDDINDDPFKQETGGYEGYYVEGNSDSAVSCGYYGRTKDQARDDTYTPEDCGDNWVLMAEDTFEIKNNEHEYIPLRIVVPKENVKDGQYIFNIDVCENEVNTDDNICTYDGDRIVNRYGSRQKLYVQIE
ncbi:MAG: hypothetical protein ACQESE_02250 [Nanobdellota archaeon]